MFVTTFRGNCFHIDLSAEIKIQKIIAYDISKRYIYWRQFSIDVLVVNSQHVRIIESYEMRDIWSGFDVFW